SHNPPSMPHRRVHCSTDRFPHRPQATNSLPESAGPSQTPFVECNAPHAAKRKTLDLAESLARPAAEPPTVDSLPSPTPSLAPLSPRNTDEKHVLPTPAYPPSAPLATTLGKGGSNSAWF